MRVFVAGATGVVGQLVARELLARGHRVTGLARSATNEALLRSLGVVPAPGDLFDPDSLARAAAGAEVVVHLATAIPTVARPTPRDWKENDRIRVDGTASLLEAARRVRARFYVQQSVALVHGSMGDTWVDETSPLIPHRIFDSAVTMERLVREAGERHGLRWAILRGGSLYHPNSSQTKQMIAGLKSGRLAVIGMGANFQSLIHGEDMARACATVVEAQPAGETFLVTDDEPARVRDLYTAIAREISGPKPRYLPPAIARLTAGNLTVDLATASLRCRNAKLKRQLGWAPRYPSYREGWPAILRAAACVAER